MDATGDGARLAQWLGGARLPIRVSDGDAAVTAFGVATTAGDLVVT